jgi:hypothetical protein|tara:strand:- start:356 stop:733 length:378 start_codon:yes stop_codon:yes gene_type:complete
MPRRKPGQYPIAKDKCGAIAYAQAQIQRRQQEVEESVAYQMFEAAQADLNALINEIGTEMGLAGRPVKFEAKGDKYFFVEGGADDPVVGQPEEAPEEDDAGDEPDDDESEDEEDSGVGAAATGSD